MGQRFIQGNLNDGDVIACWLLSQDTAESFEKLIERRRHQVEGEIVQLREMVLPKISPKEWERMGRIYLTSRSENCSMKQAEEYLTLLDEKRTEKDTSVYGRIAQSLKTPKYSTTEEKPQREKGKEEVEVLEWIPDAGTIARYDKIKNKRKREVK